MRGDNVLLRWVKDGKQHKEKLPYKPYFFVPVGVPPSLYDNAIEEDYKTLDGHPVEKIEFKTIKEAREFLDAPLENEPYGFTRFAYPFIFDNFPETIEYDPSKIRVGYLDIEVDSEGGFPDVEKADRAVTAITIRYKNRSFVFGMGEFESDDPEVFYIKCLTERQLLNTFLRTWRKLNLDVVSGYNVKLFDIPYLVNRIKNLMHQIQINKLSPWGVVKESKKLIMGRWYVLYDILGVSTLDFFDLYKKFAYIRTGQDSFKESRKLDYIAEKELGERKIDWHKDYSSLTDLYKNNHQLFIEYNIHDCYLVDKLNEKLKFIELVFAIAYDAHVNYNDALTSVLLWDVICYNHLMRRKIVPPKHPKKTETRVIMGAHVKEPKLGVYEWVVSLDLTSLYPSLIMQYNISPETYVGKTDDLTIDGLLEGKIIGGFDPTFVPAIAANGCMYKRTKQGFLPALMEKQFAKRAEYKSKMLELKKKRKNKETRLEIGRLDALQLSKKIQINSLYGALANPHFRYFNQDLAESITYSGQLAIRWAEKAVNEFLNEQFNTGGADYVIASDTDSLYLDCSDVLDLLLNVPMIDQIDKYTKNHIEPVIAKAYEELATYTNAYQNKMKMNREVIADRGIWTGAKRYVLNVWDDEGERYDEPKLKVIGMEAVRSDTPEISRNAILESLRIIMNDDEATLKEFVDGFKKKFLESSFEQISFPSGVSEVDGYFDDARLFKKGAPIHVKASIMYNKLLEDKHLTDKYELIYNGAKIRFCYLTTPNPVFAPVIASMGELPKEFGLDKYIDKETQFEKTFLTPLERITTVIGWHVRSKDSLEVFL